VSARRGSWWEACTICPPKKDGAPAQHYTGTNQDGLDKRHKRILAAAERQSALEAQWGHLRTRREAMPPLETVRHSSEGRPLAHPLREVAILDEGGDRAAARDDWRVTGAFRATAREALSAWLRRQIGDEVVLSDLDEGIGLREFERFWDEAEGREVPNGDRG